jgi:hypothetical protein
MSEAPRARSPAGLPPSRAYKRPYAALRGTPHVHNHFFLSPEPSIATTSAAPATTASSPPPAVDPPSRAPEPKVGIGEGPPRRPLRFPLSPAAAAPGAPPARATRPPSLSRSGGRGGRRKGIFAHTPLPFSPLSKLNPPFIPSSSSFKSDPIP